MVHGLGVIPTQLPNALHTFDSHVGSLLSSGTPVCVFLDYDGTLTPIVSDPDAALIPEGTRSTLAALRDRHWTALVTGRSSEKIHGFVGIERGIYYAGSHGLHISGGVDAEPLNILHPVAVRARSVLERVRDEFLARLVDVPGFSVEDNALCISAHYRQVPVELQARVQETVDAVLHEVEEVSSSAAAAADAAAGISSISLLSTQDGQRAAGAGVEQSSDDASNSAVDDGAAGGDPAGPGARALSPMSDVPAGADVRRMSGEVTTAAASPRSALDVHEDDGARQATTDAGNDSSSGGDSLMSREGARDASSVSATVPAASWPALIRHEGKMVHEIRPQVDWHKGKAVEWLYRQMCARAVAADEAAGAAPRPAPVPIYIGDDVADEDGFSAVKALHARAVAIKVTARDAVAGAAEVRPTLADYQLEDPAQVVDFLRRMITAPASGAVAAAADGGARCAADGAGGGLVG